MEVLPSEYVTYTPTIADIPHGKENNENRNARTSRNAVPPCQSPKMLTKLHELNFVQRQSLLAKSSVPRKGVLHKIVYHLKPALNWANCQFAELSSGRSKNYSSFPNCVRKNFTSPNLVRTVRRTILRFLTDLITICKLQPEFRCADCTHTCAHTHKQHMKPHLHRLSKQSI